MSLWYTYFVPEEYDCRIILFKASWDQEFEINGCNFGWMATEDLFARQIEHYCLRRVKDLQENFIN